MQKLWGGRFAEKTACLLEYFNSSLSFDKELYQEDIQGSMIHAEMLAKQGIITQKEYEDIIKGLAQIKQEIEDGAFSFDISLEDIHMAIETRLIALIGDSGKKLHTARSRNDQVALDFRIYVLKNNILIKKLLLDVAKTMLDIAQEHTETLMPGMTHLQHAQPINLAYHLVAYICMFKRDIQRLNDDYKRNNYCPLGSAALAGSPHNIDRHFVAEKLGFIAPSINAMDSVSDRDFVLDFHYSLSMIALHISRLAEELILWNSSEFSFITINDSHATGSSIMPQKKNPDIAELLRGKSGRVFGNLVALLVVMKGLPLAYNKDTQEDKEGLIDSIAHINMALKILKSLLLNITFNKDNMLQMCKKGHLSATDLADFFVSALQIPFREAHHITGTIVAYAEKNHRDITELNLEDLCKICPQIPQQFLQKALKVLDLKHSMNSRQSFGGTSTKTTQEQINILKQWLKEEESCHL